MEQPGETVSKGWACWKCELVQSLRQTEMLVLSRLRGGVPYPEERRLVDTMSILAETRRAYESIECDGY